MQITPLETQNLLFYLDGTEARSQQAPFFVLQGPKAWINLRPRQYESPCFVILDRDQGYHIQVDPIRTQDKGSGVTECSITAGTELHYSMHTREEQLLDSHTHLYMQVPQQQSYYSGDSRGLSLSFR